MVTATTARPTDRHPWIDVFLADPAVQLDNLLSGHARIEPYERADAPDAARLLFGGLAKDDDARAVLDRVLQEWLESHRGGGVPELDRLPLERWIRKVSEAFEIVGSLMLHHCSLDLRQRYVVWNSWADRLVVSDQRDGRYGFFRTLALTQRLVAGAEPTANPFAFEPLWLRVCEQAGSTFAPHYLAVGLLGLRMLPEHPDGIPSERLWMAGLAGWATAQRPSVTDFSQHWWALKGLYPRMPAYWRRAARETLNQSPAKQMPEELKQWWQHDVNAEDGTTAQQPGTESFGVPSLAPLSAVQSLRNRARNPLPSITKEIETLIGERRRYAEATGDSHFLVTTACNIGMAIIEGTDDQVGRGQLAVDLARQALAWQPANFFAWALWRDALAVQGAFEAAELVGWEVIQRYPENAKFRNQLALLLVDLPGRQPDAETLLRETIDRFPDNVVARNQLAELLIALDRTVEATDIVDGIFSRHLEDAASLDLRARLLFDASDIKAAREVLYSGVVRFPTNPILQAHRKMLNDEKALQLKALAYRSEATAPETSDTTTLEIEKSVGKTIRQRGRLRRLLSEYRQRQGDGQWRGTALAEVKSILSEDTNLAYARYLLQELEGADGEGASGGPFAVAFTEAVRRKDAERFAQLEKDFSGQAQLVDVAKACLFGDRPAANRALPWLKQDDRNEPRTVSALRGFLRQRFDISAIMSGEAFVNLVADNDNIQADLIESALAGDELLLVA